jgi:uncharacterized protein (UPF0147 family)
MAKTKEKNLNAAIMFLQRLAANETIEPDQAKAIRNAVKKLKRALRQGSHPGVVAAIDEIAKLFLKQQLTRVRIGRI